MVSNILLLHINQRLVEIFGCNSIIHFAGLTVIFCELTEVMRPKGDDTFNDLFNNVRTASINDHDEKLLKSPGLHRIMMLIIQLLHIFSENRSADQHNSVMLNEIS